MDKQRKTTAGILVDYDLYENDTEVRQWVLSKEGQASLIALVHNPLGVDPDHSQNINPDWDVVIRNGKDRPKNLFLIQALSLIQESSNIIPAVAVSPDPDHTVYQDAGVLVVINYEQIHRGL